MDDLFGNYEKAEKEIVPAARLFIAAELKRRYDMKEQEIANLLGVAQAAVSKYLNGRYSEKVSELKEAIMKDERFNLYIEKIHEKKEHYVELCICTVCRTMTNFKCKFSYTDRVAEG